MIIRTFYIGALALEYQGEYFPFLETDDGIFSVPVLPPTKRVFVITHFVDSLPISPPSALELVGAKTWETKEGEIRIYAEDSSASPWLLSQYNKIQNIVDLFIVESRWAEKRGFFRLWYYIHLDRLLLSNQALILHSASIIYRGQAILFTAPAGTGKTTQTNLWHQYHSDTSDLNGDRTLLQRGTSGWLACGYPLCGNSGRCVQTAVPIAAIVVLCQGDLNEIVSLSPMQRVAMLYSETTVFSYASSDVVKVMDLLEDIANHVTILQLNSTISEGAVNLLHQALFGE